MENSRSNPASDTTGKLKSGTFVGTRTEYESGSTARGGSFGNGKRTSSQMVNPLRINPELVVKQGLLFKKEGMLRSYKKLSHFYLERRDEQTGCGPYLKYGRKGKPIKHVMDLSYRPSYQTEAFNGILLIA
jgi:hypothetical protein